MGYNVYSTGVNSINHWDLKTGVYMVVNQSNIELNWECSPFILLTFWRSL